MPLTQAYKKVKNSIVQVIALNGQTIISNGSGSVIDSGSLVLTCAHCVIPNAQMAIAHPSQVNTAIYGNVIFSDQGADIAIIQFTQIIGTPVSFQNSSTCEVGNGAFVVGFPMGVGEQTLHSAHIASITTGSTSHLRIDASVNHGNSGGPLFNLNGEQIGVVNAKHGSLSQFLSQVKNARPSAMISIDGIDPVQAIQQLINEMQRNLNLGIGYAIPTQRIKSFHPILSKCIP
ncbi:MAG: serine protease [Nitrospirota bacterium]|nr:serine protease [Nitrospirota bacterium]